MARAIQRGEVTYEDIDDEIIMSMRDSEGNYHIIGRIYANDGDWQKIVSGADPVKDGWEDGTGHGTTVAQICDIDPVIKMIRENVAKNCNGWEPGYTRVRDDLLEDNDYVSPDNEWNGLADECDVRIIIDGYIESYINDKEAD